VDNKTGGIRPRPESKTSGLGRPEMGRYFTGYPSFHVLLRWYVKNYIMRSKLSSNRLAQGERGTDGGLIPKGAALVFKVD
jgi:hypothetical protein